MEQKIPLTKDNHKHLNPDPITVKIGPNGPIRDEEEQSSTPIRDEREMLRRAFMASDYVEWAPFAKSVGRDPLKDRPLFPVGAWVAEKKRHVALVQAEHIAQQVFDHKSNWHKDVLDTIREYPKTADALLGIIKRRMNEIIKDINADVDAEQKAAARGEPPPINKNFSRKNWPTKEIDMLANSFKTISNAKYDSLLLSDWNVKLAQEATNPVALGAPVDETKKEDTGWTIELTGGNKLTPKTMQDLFSRYLDTPDSPRDVSPKVDKLAAQGIAQSITKIIDVNRDDDDDYGQDDA